MSNFLICADSDDILFQILKNNSVIFTPVMTKKTEGCEYILFKFSDNGIKFLEEFISEALTQAINFFDFECNAYLIDKNGIKKTYENEKSFSVKNLKRSIKKKIRLKNFSLYIRKKDGRKTNSLYLDELRGGGISLIYPSFKRLKFFNSCERKLYRLRLHMPNTQERLPLIVFSHGAGAPGFDNFKQLTEVLPLYRRLKRAKNACIILAVQLGYDDAYNTDEYSEMLWNLINTINIKYENVDFSRIYLAGNSYGGYETIYEAFRHPERYAGAVSAVGWIYTDTEPQISYFKFGEDKYHLPFDCDGINELAKTPIWLAYSNVEMDYNKALYEKLETAGADVKFTRNDKYGHGLGRTFYRDYPWDEWLFEKIRKET